MSNSIQDRIKEIAEEELGVLLSEEDTLKESGLDSLSLVSLIVSIEDAFRVSFTDNDLQPDKLNSLADLVRITERRI